MSQSRSSQDSERSEKAKKSIRERQENDSDTEVVSAKTDTVLTRKSKRRSNTKKPRASINSLVIVTFDHDNVFKRFDPKDAFINLLAEQVKNEFDKIQVRHGINKIYKLSSKKLTDSIGCEIVEALRDIKLSETQRDIIQTLMTKIMKKRCLPATFKNIVGSAHNDNIFSLDWFDKKSASGLCAIYMKAINLDEMINYDSACYTLYYGKPADRIKRVQQSFYRLLVESATPLQLAALKNESNDKQITSLNALRLTHGLFSKNKTKNTGRYKKYVAHIEAKVGEMKK